ncbi:hypothetical protein ACQ4PT_046857 [Festuca glaucescens]
MRTSSRGFPSQKLQNPSPTSANSTLSDPSSAGIAEAALALPRSPVELLRAFSVEIAWVSFLICVFLKYFTGKKQNEVIALAWATKFATRDSIFHKKFSLLGTSNGKDTPPLLKEGQYEFKFYASGRRGGWLCPAPGQSTDDRAGQLRPLGFLFVKHDREIIRPMSRRSPKGSRHLDTTEISVGDDQQPINFGAASAVDEQKRVARTLVAPGTVVFAEVLGRTLSGRRCYPRGGSSDASHGTEPGRQIIQLDKPIELKIYEWNTGGLLTRIGKLFLEAEEMAKRYGEKLPVVSWNTELDYGLQGETIPFDMEATLYANWKWFKFLMHGKLAEENDQT